VTRQSDFRRITLTRNPLTVLLFESYQMGERSEALFMLRLCLLTKLLWFRYAARPDSYAVFTAATLYWTRLTQVGR
jgi:hypothetical protein